MKNLNFERQQYPMIRKERLTLRHIEARTFFKASLNHASIVKAAIFCLNSAFISRTKEEIGAVFRLMSGDTIRTQMTFSKKLELCTTSPALF